MLTKFGLVRPFINYYTAKNKKFHKKITLPIPKRENKKSRGNIIKPLIKLHFYSTIVSLTGHTTLEGEDMGKTRAKFDYRKLTEKDFQKFCWIVVGIITLRYGITGRQAAGKKSHRRLKWPGDYPAAGHELGDEALYFAPPVRPYRAVQHQSRVAETWDEKSRWKRKEINEATLKVIWAYERMAGRYGLWLLHQCGIDFLDQWVADWSNGDLNYLVMLYTTGAKYELTGSFLRRYKKKYIKFSSKLIKPLRVPQFTPKKGPSRFSF